MDRGQPSRTAFGAAVHRAAHQVVEGGRIFADPYAVAILGMDAEHLRAVAQADEAARPLRLFIAARSHFAEAALGEGVETRGVVQLVVLGAGLDTFGCRNPFADRLSVFEVDHPATQAWKRARLAEAGIPCPPSLVFVPVDFERDDLIDSLVRAGFDPARRSFFSWLGVVPYLTEAAIRSTLAAIASLGADASLGGAEVVFDYSDPPSTLPPQMRAWRRDLAARVATAGEPFLTWFEPPALHAMLKALGFTTIEDLGPNAIRASYFGLPGTGSDRGGHVFRAATAVQDQRLLLTRQTVFPTSSATSSAPTRSTATPTGRPWVSPPPARNPVRKSCAIPEGRPPAKGTKTTL